MSVFGTLPRAIGTAITLGAAVTGATVGCEPAADLEARLRIRWEERGESPADYLVGKFAERRWIFVGEYHRVRHDVELIAELVPRLHAETGVRNLALEFLCRDQTAEANRLVTAAEWDRDDAIDFFRAQFPSWSYEEYLEVFRRTWDSNRRRAAERGPFRLVGLHPCIDWEAVHFGDDPAAAARERIKQERYDAIMAEALEEQVLRPGHPALIFTGIAHATGKFTEYRAGSGEPLPRMGNLVRRGPWRDDMWFVALHAPFWDAAAGREIYPFDGILDRMMLRHGKDVGFDVVGSPFADLAHRERAERSITAHRFGELYDGYIQFHTPIRQWVGATCIEDWVTTEAELRAFARGLASREAAKRFSAMSLAEFRADHCAPRPDHGVEFRRRFRDLPELAVRNPRP